MEIELSVLSDKDLIELQKSVSNEIERRNEQRREQLRKDFEARLKEADLDWEDVVPASHTIQQRDKKRRNEQGEITKRLINPKYRNAVTGETWAGRGAHPPMWVASILNERQWTLEDFKSSDEFKA